MASTCFLFAVFLLSSSYGEKQLKTRFFKPQFNDLTSAKDFIDHCLALVHQQSINLVLASERDFPLNISSELLRFPQSYQTTLVQISSDYYQIAFKINQWMYRLQLDMKKIPMYIRNILKLFEAKASVLREKMMPTYFNHIRRTVQDNIDSLKPIIDQWTKFRELSQLIRITSTALTIFDGFYSRTDTLVQRIGEELDQILNILIDLEHKTRWNLSVIGEKTRWIANLYDIEQMAYFFYQFASLYNELSDRYIIEQLAGISRYIFISIDEERSNILSALSTHQAKVQKDADMLCNQFNNEYHQNNLLLQDAYERLS